MLQWEGKSLAGPLISCCRTLAGTIVAKLANSEKMGGNGGELNKLWCFVEQWGCQRSTKNIILVHTRGRGLC